VRLHKPKEVGGKTPQLSPFSALSTVMQHKFVADLVRNASALPWMNVKQYGALCDVSDDRLKAVFYNSTAMRKALNQLGWTVAYTVPMSQCYLWTRKDGTWPLYHTWRAQNYIWPLAEHVTQEMQSLINSQERI